MKYDHKLDRQIISQIEKEGGSSTFNELKKKTRTNSLTLTRHLDNLEKHGIIVRSSSSDNPLSDNNEPIDDRRIGKKRYCYLTKAAKFEIKRGLFIGVRSKREERNKTCSNGGGSKERGRQDQLLSSEQKLNRLFQLLLLIAQRGALRYIKKSDGEEEAGDLFEYDPKEKRHFAYRVSILPGVGESDFHADNIVKVTDYRGIFGYLSPTERERKDLFRSLQSSDPPIIKQIEDEEGPYKEARYGLADKRLEGLISKILELFQYVYLALKAKWNYLRKPTKKEFQWYRMFYGDAKTRFFFERLFKEGYLESHDDQRFSYVESKWLRNRLKGEILKGQKDRYFKNCARANKLKDGIDKNYGDMTNRYSSSYSSIIKAMIDEIYSPLK